MGSDGGSGTVWSGTPENFPSFSNPNVDRYVVFLSKMFMPSVPLVFFAYTHDQFRNYKPLEAQIVQVNDQKNIVCTTVSNDCFCLETILFQSAVFCYNHRFSALFHLLYNTWNKTSVDQLQLFCWRIGIFTYYINRRTTVNFPLFYFLHCSVVGRCSNNDHDGDTLRSRGLRFDNSARQVWWASRERTVRSGS